ncbi:unnamed protein product [marine sediment metagenome]|uniref:Uncharacterized protein n=1 Tax=marine sediment metagenome TaxID=412755 RepID=X0RYR0_9ZZZZ
MAGMKITKMFFDTKKVISATDRATRRVFSKFGAFVRRGARSSIRKRKAVSAPGKPPSSHVGLLKKLIYFGYDTDKQTVVIGPTPLGGKAEVPALLEYGGRKVVMGRRGRKQRKRQVATYSPRPFMGPAFEKEKPKLPAMWADSIK